jgi:hypothetical protein
MGEPVVERLLLARAVPGVDDWYPETGADVGFLVTSFLFYFPGVSNVNSTRVLDVNHDRCPVIASGE